MGINLPLVRFLRERIDTAITVGDGALDISAFAYRAAIEAGLNGD
jgi:hypothetical protein